MEGINRFLAKSKPEQTIKEHTSQLEENYHLLKSLFPNIPINWEILLTAVLFHDLGKVNAKFQNKLYKRLKYPLIKDEFPNDEEIPHGNLSPAFLNRKQLKEKFAEHQLRILYQAIYFHHPRTVNEKKLAYLRQVIKQELGRYAPDFHFLSSFFKPSPCMDYQRYISNRIDYSDDKEVFYQYVLIKGLLNRLDYAASAHVPIEITNHDLEQKTLLYLNGLGGLRDIQKYMLAHQECNHIIVASTGIGKTEAGLLWFGNNKGFFTLPLRVSINAIYQRIKKEKIGFEPTALLHSDALSFLISSNESIDYLREYTKARLFSMPLTITTVDQLFKFVFKGDGFEPVLATLACSKIIIDEIQMYSPEIIACLLMGLKYITEVGGKFSILTATFPAILELFLKKMGVHFQYREFILNQTRHRIQILDQDITVHIHKMIEKSFTSKVLVIVNTVKKAQEIFRLIKNVKNKYLLHSRFIGRDRKELEDKIVKFSESKQTGIWITTQVVEASLDLDFDYLFTELSTVDGLFQRMGRCFRKRELTTDTINVFVFTKNASGVGKIIDRELFELSKKAIKKYDLKVMSETDKLEIIKDVYSEEKIGPTEYFESIKKRLRLLEDIPAYEFDRSEVERHFRNILSYTVIPIGVYNDNLDFLETTIQEINNLGFSNDDKTKRVKLMDKIKKLTLDVPYYFEEDLQEVVSIDKKNQFRIINREYNKSMGLLKKPGISNIN